VWVSELGRGKQVVGVSAKFQKFIGVLISLPDPWWVVGAGRPISQTVCGQGHVVDSAVPGGEGQNRSS
jgi:hypothetical protein